MYNNGVEVLNFLTAVQSSTKLEFLFEIFFKNLNLTTTVNQLFKAIKVRLT